MRQLNRVSRALFAITAILCAASLSTGCEPTTTNQANPSNQTSGYAVQAIPPTGRYVSVDRSAYDPGTQSVTLWVHAIQPAGWQHLFNHKGPSGEQVIDTSTQHGINNYVVAQYPSKSIRSVHLIDAKTARSAASEGHSATSAARSVMATHRAVSIYAKPKTASAVLGLLPLGDEADLVTRLNRSWYQISFHGQTGYLPANPNLVQVTTRPQVGTRTYQLPKRLIDPDRGARTAAAADEAVPVVTGSRLPSGSSRSGYIHIPPPGVWLDRTIQPRVKQTAPRWMKEDAVINEARTKLGTPYIWGHNEDRGQYGFDCSNYTAYVYHHAVGYKFTTSSRGQSKYVGVSVPVRDMQRGDLIIFEYGRHTGIYTGHHRMIQAGGGLGKVGYLSLDKYSYWGKHITSVKRMF